MALNDLIRALLKLMSSGCTNIGPKYHRKNEDYGQIKTWSDVKFFSNFLRTQVFYLVPCAGQYHLAGILMKYNNYKNLPTGSGLTDNSLFFDLQSSCQLGRFMCLLLSLFTLKTLFLELTNFACILLLLFIQPSSQYLFLYTKSSAFERDLTGFINLFDHL